MSFDWKINISDVLKIVGVAIAVIYTVARIEFTTDQLTISINHLTTAVAKLDSKVEIARDDVFKLRERLSVIEHLQVQNSKRE